MSGQSMISPLMLLGQPSYGQPYVTSEIIQWVEEILEDDLVAQQQMDVKKFNERFQNMIRHLMDLFTVDHNLVNFLQTCLLESGYMELRGSPAHRRQMLMKKLGCLRRPGAPFPQLLVNWIFQCLDRVGFNQDMGL